MVSRSVDSNALLDFKPVGINGHIFWLGRRSDPLTGAACDAYRSG